MAAAELFQTVMALCMDCLNFVLRLVATEGGARGWLCLPRMSSRHVGHRIAAVASFLTIRRLRGVIAIDEREVIEGLVEDAVFMPEVRVGMLYGRNEYWGAA